MDCLFGLPTPVPRAGEPETSPDLLKHTAPPAGLEPAPPAPEAGALSAELRGRVQRHRGGVSRHAGQTDDGPRPATLVACHAAPRWLPGGPVASHLMPGQDEPSPTGRYRP